VVFSSIVINGEVQVQKICYSIPTWTKPFHELGSINLITAFMFEFKVTFFPQVVGHISQPEGSDLHLKRPWIEVYHTWQCTLCSKGTFNQMLNAKIE
jgi:hypothetical protein